MFQATGASAGTAKCSNELSIPTIRPDSASRTTIGNMICARLTVRLSELGVEARREQGHDRLGAAG